ncbi:pyridoxal phosphate-dependent aminotransferase [Lawsonella clevelandensis]|uniref:alanine transaminase n=1 Tax=Lawsonella clevelandensis TaxID=1528099 RepID=A0A5E3ZXG3_9ACTN|nr:pyridoxal phosphate-dependent aminotransferase [Lawsonella clevelandensis]VHO00996.1 putative aspartate aminotransferase [Lawsonella clevelandensis]
MSLRPLYQSKKLKNVVYDIRGPVLDRANELEAQGAEILKLNIGNPGKFGFLAPQNITTYMKDKLDTAVGYSDSRGIAEARQAVINRYANTPGFPEVGMNSVYIGNGASELITMSLQSLCNPGDEILVPAPDYPLWTASTALAGGTPVHYLLDEANDWNPSLEDIESKITDKTKAIVVINPNNPTGAVFSKETLEGIVDIARRHSLLIFADEIYDLILYTEAPHHNLAALAPDLLVFTFNGLSKSYRACGYRAGWVVITGPKDHARDFLAGFHLMASMRLCSNVPAQYAIVAALEGEQDIQIQTAPGGRLYEQWKATVDTLDTIPGVSVVVPKGSLYAFPRFDPEVYPISDDEKFAMSLVENEHILMTHGTAFNYPTTDHLRIVMLPEAAVLKEAIERLGNFLSSYKG